MSETEKMQIALQIIASWQDVDVESMNSKTLLEVIRSMITIANEALEVEKMPWE